MTEDEDYYSKYDYGAREPVGISSVNLREDQRHKLIESNVFCILPWIHLHGWPTGEAYPCCIGDEKHPIGNLRSQSLAEIWNDAPMRQMRRNMIQGKPCIECHKCYDQESKGLFSMRNSSNKHFGHHIDEVDATEDDGTLSSFKIRYWDIRFSNICNFKCRYCGPNFSSAWHDDKKILYGSDGVGHDKFIYAGGTKDAIWEQMLEHIPHLEQIYFAGGEPLLMEEHYRLLNELISRGMTNVRLIYNTNFSELRFKKQDVLELWKQFDSVSVGASLDGMGARAEYMRKGTVWSEIESNRLRMMAECPSVDFYISATVSVFNVLHIADFHRDWADRGLISPQDFNINVLYGPQYYRCDILPPSLKIEAMKKIDAAIEWLSGQDHLTRATIGYQGLKNFMIASNGSKNIKHFLAITDQLDRVRGEKFDAIFPELGGLREYA